MKLNNTPLPDVMAVQIADERLAFDLQDGRTVSVPLSFYPTLQLAHNASVRLLKSAILPSIGPSWIATSVPTVSCAARRKIASSPNAPSARR